MITSFFRTNYSPVPLDRNKLLRSYAPDWIITISLAIVFFLLENVDGFKREFSVSDTSLFHPFAVQERVSDTALFFIAFVAPLLLQWLTNLLTIRNVWDAHNSALGLILSLSLSGAFTHVTKVTVGRPRPDLIHRCQPDPETIDPPFGFSSVAICHYTNRHIINDGFKSFPSGHSSLSFAGLTFLSLYLAGKLQLFDKRGHVAKVWTSVLPLLGATLVAISRLMDYRHHWQDVVVGSALGISTAYFSYRQYFPSLASKLSHLPYAPRNQSLEGNPPDGLPFYRNSSDDHVELYGTVRRGEPQPGHIWDRGPSEESGREGIETRV
ncbi:PAP2-domain-containing protein [Lactifluus volemus]|nr:PAP2-domain-containing protein [Lactifluus volemus]